MNVYDLALERGAASSCVVWGGSGAWQVLATFVFFQHPAPFVFPGWLGVRWVCAFPSYIFLYLVQFWAI